MADNPEEVKPNRNETDCPEAMESVSQKQPGTSSVADSPHPDQFNPDGMRMDVTSASVSAAAFSPSGRLSPVTVTLSPHDIDCFIGSFDLKSEEITSLMAEKVPSSETDETYDPLTTLKLENKDDPHYSEEDVKKLAAGKVKLDEDTMKSWLADGSDDSDMSLCREPPIPLNDESDMEEFNNNKENVKSDTKVNNEKEEPFVDDLISLKISEENILEPPLNHTAVASENLLDIKNALVSNQTAIGNKSLLDIDIETLQDQTAVSNNSLLDTELETLQNQADVSNNSLLDIKLESMQNLSDVANKNMLDTECEKGSPDGKQDYNSAAKKYAEICSGILKNNLIEVIKNVKKSDSNSTAINVDAANGNGLKSLEEELRREDEAKSTKRNAPNWDSEMGLPKANVPDSLRVVKDENFQRNIKKIGGYMDKLKIPSDDISNDSDLKKNDDDEVFQNDEADVVPQETLHERDPNETADVASTQEASPVIIIEENTLHNVTTADMDSQGVTETNIANESLQERLSQEKTTEDNSKETPAAEKNAETDNVGQETKTAVMKSILKKHVSFASTRGHPGMEHMALHHEETKIEERQLDMETPLRFLTETYPSHEDEEMLSESLNATLEPCALSRSRRESSRAAELYEELKILEGDEPPKTISVSPYQSPERPDFPDSAIDKTVTNKSGNKFSRFFKSFKKKIWN